MLRTRRLFLGIVIMLSLSSVLIAGATPGFADNFGINPQGTVATTPTSTPIATLTHPPHRNSDSNFSRGRRDNERNHCLF